MSKILPIVRPTPPRLFHLAGDLAFHDACQDDPVRKLILRNIQADCRAYETVIPPGCIRLVPDSPHPFHQLYITFYEAMRAAALIEQYAFAWKFTGNDRWLNAAKRWLNAAVGWEHSNRIEEHFYSANRYMHAFAIALDLLDKELTVAENDRVTQRLIEIMQRWWPKVDSDRHNPKAGHHPVVDNAHFGTAALALLGKTPQAAEWIAAVLDRFRVGLLPNGCGPDGAPYDGPSFWGGENMWRIQFMEALLNVTGIDLYREFPNVIFKPLHWLRYHIAAPARIANVSYDAPNANILTGDGQLQHISPILLKLAQLAGDKELRDFALADQRMGRIFRYGDGVKNSAAECMVAWGPYAYMFYDPICSRWRRQKHLALARVFRGATGRRDEAVMRTGWEQSAVVALIRGNDGSGGHGTCQLHLQWTGHPLLREICCAEAQPFSAGAQVQVGGQPETYGIIESLIKRDDGHRITVDSPRTKQEYRLIHGEHPVVIAAARLKPRGVQGLQENGIRFVRLSGADYLQYPREPYFNPDAGRLRLRVRIDKRIPTAVPACILFGVGGFTGAAGNSFAVGFFGDDRLAFRVTNQQWLTVWNKLPARTGRLRPGKWHDIVIRWGGLNDSRAACFTELELDGIRHRVDDPAKFSALKSGAQGLAHGGKPSVFRCRPNTVLSFGGAVQAPGTAIPCDIAAIEMHCANRKHFSVAADRILSIETGSGPLTWSVKPAKAGRVRAGRAILAAGRQIIALLAAFPRNLKLNRIYVPYAPTGFAAGSRKSFRPARATASACIVAGAHDASVLALVFAEAGAKPHIAPTDRGFDLAIGRKIHHVAVNCDGKDLLHIISCGSRNSKANDRRRHNYG